jgi:hypothetical protein
MEMNNFLFSMRMPWLTEDYTDKYMEKTDTFLTYVPKNYFSTIRHTCACVSCTSFDKNLPSKIVVQLKHNAFCIYFSKILLGGGGGGKAHNAINFILWNTQ